MSEWETPRSVRETGSAVRLPPRQAVVVGNVTPSRVAAVTPSQQVDTGPLSPLSTPRLPLQELSGLDAWSPSVLTTTQLEARQSPLASGPCGAGTGVTAPYGTGVGPPGLWTMRHQINTERQLNDLKEQVEQLTSQFYLRTVNESEKENEEETSAIVAERDAALAALADRDKKLGALQAGIAQMNVEYAEDIGSVRGEVEKLREEIDEGREKFNTMETEYKKSLKTIQALRGYITTLPAVEEMRELKSKLRTREENLRDAETLAESVESQLRESESVSRRREERVRDLEVENEELRERLTEAAGKLKGYESRHYAARNLGQDETEHLLFDKESLAREVEHLKKILDWKQRKFEDETSRKEEQIRQVGSLLEEANIQLKAVRSEMRELTANNTEMKAELVANKECDKLVDAVKRNVVLEMEVKNLRMEDKTKKRLDGYYTRLFRSLGCCLKELNGLNELVRQMLDNDPNMSLLLGVREGRLTVSDSLLKQPLEDLTVEQRVELVRGQMEEVRKLQEDIGDVRNRLQERYADSLADNMTSCVTQ